MDNQLKLAPGREGRGEQKGGELRGWSLIALAALAVSGVLAPLLALSRAPGMERYLPWAETAFQRAIIEHVVFSVVVWTLAVFGALMCVAVQGSGQEGGQPKANRLGPVAVWAMLPVFILLFVPGVMSGAKPSLNNYVPVMIHPFYYSGLGVLFAALALPVLRLWLNRARIQDSALGMGAASAAAAYAMAILCFVIAASQLSGAVPSVAYNEDLFWGGGHVLQIVNTIVMLSAWCLLGEVALGRPLVSRKALKAAFGLCLIAAVAAPIFYAFFTFESGDLGVAHSQLKYVLGLPALIVVFSALKNVGKISFLNQRRSPAFTALSLSVILFAIGGVMGLFADGADTRTPAHYHGVLGAVNLAFFGVVMFYILPLLGRGLKPTRWRFAPLYVYAVGQLLQSLGLFIAEAPRKTMGAAQALDSALAKIGMHMNNSGGAIAVIGGILFVWIAGRALLGRTSDSLE